jgi:hypothetical protein
VGLDLLISLSIRLTPTSSIEEGCRLAIALFTLSSFNLTSTGTASVANTPSCVICLLISFLSFGDIVTPIGSFFNPLEFAAALSIALLIASGSSSALILIGFFVTAVSNPLFAGVNLAAIEIGLFS